ncbi:MAG: hypothetical protein ACXVB0_11180 [Mucilaginibacter sp.]
MKYLLLLIAVLFLLTSTSKAQTKADKKISKANTAVNSANNTATNAINAATNTINQAKDVANKAGVAVPKNQVNGPANTTQISVKGANFATLKKLNESIQSCAGVKDSKMKFNATESTITVTHAGTTTNLLKRIQKKSDLVTDDSINDFDEGKITLTLKPPAN